MHRLILLPLLLATSLPKPNVTLDASCTPLIQSSEAKIAQPAWHSVTQTTGMSLEAMKVDGKFYIQMDGKWMAAPMDLDKAEKIAISQLQNGDIKVSHCKEEGTETLDGIEMQIFSYTSEIPASGLPATTAKLYIGKTDNLPYKITDGNAQATTVTYRYKDISAPTL